MSAHIPMSVWLCTTVVVRIMAAKDVRVLISGICESSSLHGTKDDAIAFDVGDIPGLSG